MEITTKTYKGFDKDLKCRDFQFEIGKEYEEETAICCNSGFHACEDPFDVLKYYPPATSRYCEAEQSGEIDKSNDDSKVASTKIKIGGEIGLSGIIKAGISFIIEKAKFTNGDGAHSVTNGDGAHSVTNGDGAHSVTNGFRAHSFTNGDEAHSVTNGFMAHSVTNGFMAHSVTNGDGAHSFTNGDEAHSVTNGFMAHSFTNGFRAHSFTNGDEAHSVTNGFMAHSVTNGDGAHSVTNGDGAHSEVKGKSSIAAALGRRSKAKANKGSAIVVAEYGEWDGESYPLIGIKAAIVDGKNLKADTFYMLKNGEFIEAEND